MSGWEIFLIATSLAPIPAAVIWRMIQLRRHRKIVEDLMAERRAKFKGVVRVPGSAKTRMLTKDDL